MKICIFGAGGSARETYWIAKRCGYEVEAFLDVKDGSFYDNIPIKQENYFDPFKHLAVVAIGSSIIRKKISTQIMNKYGNVFISLIDPSCILLSPNIIIGKGAVIAPKCVLTCDIAIGDFCQLNVNSVIMHDAKIGDFFTTAPGVHINGNVNIGNCVYFGSNSTTKENISIYENTIVGAGACIVKNIIESGTYAGVPATKMEKK